MMDFEPLNADHSVESVKVALFLDRMIMPADIERAQKRHDDIRSELPAFIRINDEGTGSFEFAYMRPDASSAWSLRFEDDRITVECNRYTRWSKIWETCSGYFAFALSIFDKEDDIKIEGVSLSFVDKFNASKPEHDVGSLLRHSQYTPNHIFQRNYVWHVHTGWLDFEKQGENDEAIVNSLRIECVLNEQGEKASDPGNLYFTVSIAHLQRVTYRELLKPDATGTDVLDNAVQRMHAMNKTTLRTLLTSDMLAVIGLESDR